MARIAPRAGRAASSGNSLVALTGGGLDALSWRPEEQDAVRLRQGACQHATPAAARRVGETEGRESIPWCAAATECGLAPHPVVYQARQVRNQVVRDAILLDTAREHN